MASVPYPAISNIIIGVVDRSINLYQVVWAESIDYSQSVTVSYKLSSDVLWTVVNSDLNIPPNGVPSVSPFVVLSNGTSGETYDVKVTGNFTGYEYTGQITVPQSIYANNYLVGDVYYILCASIPITLFSIEPFGPGVEMFYDIELTDPVDEDFISQEVYGEIYAISGGVVGVSTGLSCYAYQQEQFVLSNSISLCDDAIVNLYMLAPVGGELEGQILYTDKELSIPVTGYDYVLRVLTEEVFELNSATGEVEALVGACDDFYNVLIENQSSRRIITGVFGIEGFALIGAVNYGSSETGTHVAFENGISVEIAGGGSCDGCGVDEMELYVDSVLIETLKVQEGVYFFASASYTGANQIQILLKEVLP